MIKARPQRVLLTFVHVKQSEDKRGKTHKYYLKVIDQGDQSPLIISSRYGPNFPSRETRR